MIAAVWFGFECSGLWVLVVGFWLLAWCIIYVVDWFGGFCFSGSDCIVCFGILLRDCGLVNWFTC